MDKRLLLIINPAAGTKKANRYLTDIVSLFNAKGYLCTVFCTGCTGRCHSNRAGKRPGLRADRLHRRRWNLNEVISGLLLSGLHIPIGYIPAGSTNDFANSLGLSRDILTAAQDIMEGTPMPLDAGSFNGRNFSYVASFGAFTEASYATPQSSKIYWGI